MCQYDRLYNISEQLDQIIKILTSIGLPELLTIIGYVISVAITIWSINKSFEKDRLLTKITSQQDDNTEILDIINTRFIERKVDLMNNYSHLRGSINVFHNKFGKFVSFTSDKPSLNDSFNFDDEMEESFLKIYLSLLQYSQNLLDHRLALESLLNFFDDNSNESIKLHIEEYLDEIFIYAKHLMFNNIRLTSRSFDKDVAMNLYNVVTGLEGYLPQRVIDIADKIHIQSSTLKYRTIE